MAANYEAIARAHMAQQVREAATVQAALARLWEQTLDPRDVAGSFIRFRKSAAIYIGAGRTISDRTAARYVDSVARLSGVSAPGMAAAVMDPDHIELSLTGASAKSLGRASRLQRAGLDPSVALRVAMGNSLGAAKRHVLNAGRSRVTRTASSRNFRGWSRVSDGNPCAFCSMLVSRGPTYGKDSGDFAAHDRCGCSVQLVTSDDPTGGWSAQARALRDAWDEAGGDPYEYRRTIDADRRAAVDDTPLIFG